MMRLRVVLCCSAFLCAGCRNTSNGNAIPSKATGLQASHSIPDEIDAELLSKDFQMFAAVRGLLPPTNVSLKALRDGFAFYDAATDSWDTNVDEDRALGFGLHRLHALRWGDYFSCEVKVLAKNDRLARLQLTVWCGSEHWVQLLPFMLDDWHEYSVQEADRGFTWEYSEPEIEAALDVAVTAALGEQQALRASDDLAEAYQLLVDPWGAITYGDSCGDGGEPPVSREAIELLKDAGRFDVIRNVLRGANPEGRIYAAKALLESLEPVAAPTPSDLAVIERIRGLDIPISVCGGCTFYEQSASEILALPP